MANSKVQLNCPFLFAKASILKSYFGNIYFITKNIMGKNETKVCKYCATEIPMKAKICPNCKKDIRNWFVRHYWITTILVLYWWGMFMYEWTKQPTYNSYSNTNNTVNQQPQIDTSTPEWFLEQNRWVAKMMCKEAIKPQLKASKTAEFDNEDVRYTWEKWKEAQAAWEVTAQNSFWANLTNYYLCNFRWTWSDYALVDAKIIEK